MKKLIPLAVLDKIQPLIEQHRHLIKVIKDPNVSFSFEDADEKSDFYFKVEHRSERGRHVVRHKPLNQDSVQANAEELDIEGVVQSFKGWLALLERYAALHTVFDDVDPILQSYEDEFVSYFEMADADADKVPFNFEKQLLLEQYLDWVETKLEEEKVSATEQQQPELDSMISDVQTLRTNLTQLSQNKTVKGLAKFWAKARKYGLDLIKDLWAEFRKEGIKKLVQKTSKGELPNWEEINALIS